MTDKRNAADYGKHHEVAEQDAYDAFTAAIYEQLAEIDGRLDRIRGLLRGE